MKHGQAIEGATGVAGASLATGVVEPGMSMDEVGQMVGIIYCSMLVIKMICNAVIKIRSRFKK